MKREAVGCTKMKKLCNALGLRLWQAVGILESLWYLTAREAPTGNIGKLSNEDIALSLEYEGDADQLIEALLNGWLDKSEEHRLIVHDWHEHSDDTTDMKLARSGKLYASGNIPRMNKLSKREREIICSSHGWNTEFLAQKGTKSHEKALPVPVPVPKPEPEPGKQKPSRRQAASDGIKHSSDPRHVACKELIFAAYRHKNGGADPPWDGREGRALGMLLGADPGMTPETMKPILNHWARSELNHADRPSIWIPKLSSFRMAPIDRFNKPIGGENAGANKPSAAKQRVDGARRVLAEIAMQRGLVDPAGSARIPDAEVPIAGLGIEHRGVSGGLRTAGPEILPPESPGGGGETTARSGPEVLSPPG